MSAPTKRRKNLATPDQNAFIQKLGYTRPTLKRGESASPLPNPSADTDGAEASRKVQKAEADIIAYKQRNPDPRIGSQLDNLAATARQALKDGMFDLAEANCMSINTLIPPTPQRIADSTDRVKEAMTVVKDYMAKKDHDPNVLKTLTEKLREAQKLRNEHKLDEADQVCLLIVAESKKAAAPKGAEKPLSEREQREQKAKESAALAERQLDLAVAKIGEEIGPEVAEIMDRHCLLEPIETKAFAGLRWMDDLLAIKDAVERKKRVKGIREAVTDARARQQQMGKAVADVGAPDTAAGKEALALARKFQANMMNHIPAAFVNERDLDARLKVLEAVADLDPTERQRRKDLAKTISPQDLADEKKAFVDAITQGSLKPADQAEFFFDGPVRPLTPEQQKNLFAAQEKIIARAHEIKDLGGSIKEVEASLAHIPAEFWPPEFIQKLQAWRKVEREIAEERAADIFKKPEKLGDLSKAEILTGAAGILDTIGNLVNIAGGISDFDKTMDQQKMIDSLVSQGMSPADAAKDPSVIEIKGGLGSEEALCLRMVAEASSDIAKVMAPIADYVKSGNIDQLKKLMESDPKTKENVMTILGKTDAVVSKLQFTDLKTIPQLASAFPMMAAIGTGVDLMKACYQLQQCFEANDDARNLLKKANLDFYSGKSEDAALLNALINEKNAQQHRTVKKGVEVAARSISFAGDVLKTPPEGHAKAAGYAIKVVGKTLEVGHKVVFAGIEWGKAQKAMKTLKAAQAGNPTARIEIFENCGLYAKMYLAVMAQEKNPLALQLIVDRGLTEGDLTKPMALKILRDNLMKKAEQRNEIKDGDFGTVLSDNLFTEAGTRVIKATGVSIKTKAAGVKSKLSRLKGEPEAPQWTPPAAKLEVAHFEQVRQDAIKNGLDDAPELNQIADALRKIDASFERAMEASKPTSTDADFPDGKTLTISKPRLDLTALEDILERYTPTRNGATSDPMASYLHGLFKISDERRTVVNDLLHAVGRAPWTPPNGGKDVGGWTADWSSAVAGCPGLTKDDGGVKKALDAYQKQKSAAAEKGAPAKARAARLKARDDLKNVAAALNACFMECGEFDEVREFIDGWLEWVTQESQSESGAMYDEKLPANSPEELGDRAYTSDGWGDLYASATEAGLLDKGEGDHGLGKAYAKVEKCKDELLVAVQKNANGQHGKEVAKARTALIEAETEVVKASDKIARGNKDAPKQVADHLGEISKKAKEEAGKLHDEFAAVDFTVVDSAGKKGWNSTYSNAVGAGAVPENEDARKILAKALAEYNSASRSVYKYNITAKVKLEKARQFQIKSKDLKKTILRTSNIPGFDHPLLKKYLDDLKKLLEADLFRLKDVLSGKAVPAEAFKPGAFDWKQSTWEKAKKDAVDAGIITDAFTGFDRALGKCKKYTKAWKEGKPGSEEQDKAFVKLYAYLEKLEGIAKGIMGRCEHPGMKNYMETVGHAIAQRREQMGASLPK